MIESIAITIAFIGAVIFLIKFPPKPHEYRPRPYQGKYAPWYKVGKPQKGKGNYND